MSFHDRLRDRAARREWEFLVRSAVFVPDEGGGFGPRLSSVDRNDRVDKVFSIRTTYWFYDILNDSVLPL